MTDSNVYMESTIVAAAFADGPLPPYRVRRLTIRESITVFDTFERRVRHLEARVGRLRAQQQAVRDVR